MVYTLGGLNSETLMLMLASKTAGVVCTIHARMENLAGTIVSLEVDLMEEILMQDARTQLTYYWR